MNKNCQYCYKPLENDNVGEFHERCSLEFFGTKQPPAFEHSLKQMAELALTIEGKKRRLKWENFERLGIKLGLNEKQIKSIAKRFQQNKAVAIQWINNSFLSEEYKEKYKTLMEERYRSLFQRE